MPTVILRNEFADHEFEVADDDDGESLTLGPTTAAQWADARTRRKAIEARERAAEERLVATTELRDPRVLPVAMFLCKANGDTWEPDYWDH